MYSITASNRGEFINRNLFHIDDTLPSGEFFSGEYVSRKDKKMPFKMYMSQDGMMFHVIVLEEGRLYITVMLYRLEIDEGINAFYGISLGDANRSRRIVATRILIVPESDKSKDLPRSFQKGVPKGVTSEIWDPLYAYFRGPGLGAPYTACTCIGRRGGWRRGRRATGRGRSTHPPQGHAEALVAFRSPHPRTIKKSRRAREAPTTAEQTHERRPRGDCPGAPRAPS